MLNNETTTTSKALFFTLILGCALTLVPSSPAAAKALTSVTGTALLSVDGIIVRTEPIEVDPDGFNIVVRTEPIEVDPDGLKTEPIEVDPDGLKFLLR